MSSTVEEGLSNTRDILVEYLFLRALISVDMVQGCQAAGLGQRIVLHVSRDGVSSREGPGTEGRFHTVAGSKFGTIHLSLSVS